MKVPNGVRRTFSRSVRSEELVISRSNSLTWWNEWRSMFRTSSSVSMRMIRILTSGSALLLGFSWTVPGYPVTLCTRLPSTGWTFGFILVRCSVVMSLSVFCIISLCLLLMSIWGMWLKLILHGWSKLLLIIMPCRILSSLPLSRRKIVTYHSHDPCLF